MSSAYQVTGAAEDMPIHPTKHFTRRGHLQTNSWCWSFKHMHSSCYHFYLSKPRRRALWPEVLLWEFNEKMRISPVHAQHSHLCGSVSHVMMTVLTINTGWGNSHHDLAGCPNSYQNPSSPISPFFFFTFIIIFFSHFGLSSLPHSPVNLAIACLWSHHLDSLLNSWVDTGFVIANDHFGGGLLQVNPPCFMMRRWIRPSLGVWLCLVIRCSQPGHLCPGLLLILSSPLVPAHPDEVPVHKMACPCWLQWLTQLLRHLRMG